MPLSAFSAKFGAHVLSNVGQDNLLLMMGQPHPDCILGLSQHIQELPEDSPKRIRYQEVHILGCKFTLTDSAFFVVE